MKQNLYQKQSQTMLLKPKMLQSLEMLAMPMMQLEQHLKQEMITNPVLELLDNRSEDESPEEQTEMENASSEEDIDDPELQKTLEETKELSEILDSFNEYYESGEKPIKTDGDAFNFEQTMRQAEDYKARYLTQLDQLNFSEQEYDFAIELIDSINAHGYLPANLELEKVAEDYDLSAEKADEIHQIILHLHPAGITARNVVECLSAQLDYSAENRRIQDMITNHFDDLVHKRFKKIASDMNVGLNTVLNWREVVAHLDPKPGLRILSNSENFIIPDLILKKIGGDYEIIINDYSMPKVRLSPHYKDILKNVKYDKEALSYVRGKINSAKFLIKSVYLRSRTLERVMRSIITNQPGFFYEESGVLNPLTYSVIADELQVNESTISRVVRDKYADTPFGLMCLKDFFTSKAGKDDDYNSVSRYSVEVNIKKLIDAEDHYKPLSDQDIVDILKKEGVNVSRRVVTKYRQSKGILNSHLRKKEKMGD
jgi:RNA polymerase sigma-54 factor